VSGVRVVEKPGMFVALAAGTLVFFHSAPPKLANAASPMLYFPILVVDPTITHKSISPGGVFIAVVA
jgi:hypothetical protein